VLAREAVERVAHDPRVVLPVDERDELQVAAPRPGFSYSWVARENSMIGS
jgi:hypothetical protein